jgi:hypothetical protein
MSEAQVAPSVPAVVKKGSRKTQFVAGNSGNPSGRPKGSKNQITLLRQSLELQLREAAAPNMAAVMQKAVDLALEGDRSMIKLLIELHVSKQNSEETNAVDKVQIHISSAPVVTNVTPSKPVRTPDIIDAEIVPNGS